MEKWEILNSEKIIDNKWITVEKQKCRVDDGKIIDDYYIVKRKDYVILVVDDKKKISFVKQYRHGSEEIMLNLPMGLIDKGETPENAAKRELYEETGYEAEELEYLGWFYLAPVYTPVKAHVFYINKIKSKKEIKEGDTEEKLVLINIPKNEVKKMVQKNEIKDMSTLIAIHTAKDKLDLF